MGDRVVPSRSMLSYMRIHMESASHSALLPSTPPVPLTEGGVGATPQAAAAPLAVPFGVGVEALDEALDDAVGEVRGGGCGESACPFEAQAAEPSSGPEVAGAAPAGAGCSPVSHGTVDGIVARRQWHSTRAQHTRRRNLGCFACGR